MKFLLLFITVSMAYGNQEVIRLMQMEDRIKRDQYLHRPHFKWTFDNRIATGQNFLSLITEANNIGKSTVDDATKVTNATTFLNKNKNIEQYGILFTDLSLPLPDFKFYNAEILPSFDISTTLSAILSFRLRNITGTTFRVNDLIDIPDTVPTAFKQMTVPSTLTPGTDLATYARENRIISGQEASEITDAFYMPDLTIPNLNIYGKNDIKLGPTFKYFYKPQIFGHIKLYRLTRTDRFFSTNEYILKNRDEITKIKLKNTQSTVNLDFSFGIKWSKIKMLFYIEEINFNSGAKKDLAAPDLLYGQAPMVHFFADAYLRARFVDIRPFIGMHKRNGYSFVEGFYFGIRSAFATMSDSVLLSGELIWDYEYVNVAGRIKFWVMEFEYGLKTPKSSTTPFGMKSSFLHSFNARLTFTL